MAQLRIKLARLPDSVFDVDFIRVKKRVKTNETSVLASKKATITTDNIDDLPIEEAESAKKSCTVVSKTTTDDDQYSTDVISDTPGHATSRQSTKHVADQQVCNEEMANEDVVTRNCATQTTIDDWESCVRHSSTQTDEENVTGIAEDSDNIRHQLQKNYTEPPQRANLNILLRKRKRMERRMNWYVSSIENYIEKLKEEISESIKDIKEMNLFES